MNRRSVTYDGRRIRAPSDPDQAPLPDRRAVSDSAPLPEHHSGSVATPSSDGPDSVSDSFDFFSSSPPLSAEPESAGNTEANGETIAAPEPKTLGTPETKALGTPETKGPTPETKRPTPEPKRPTPETAPKPPPISGTATPMQYYQAPAQSRSRHPLAGDATGADLPQSPVSLHSDYAPQLSSGLAYDYSDQLTAGLNNNPGLSGPAQNATSLSGHSPSADFVSPESYAPDPARSPSSLSHVALASITPHLPHDSRLARPMSKAYPYPSIQSSAHLSDYTLPATTESPTLGGPGGRRYSSDPVQPHSPQFLRPELLHPAPSEPVNGPSPENYADSPQFSSGPGFPSSFHDDHASLGMSDASQSRPHPSDQHASYGLQPPPNHSTSFSFSDADNSELHISPVRESPFPAPVLPAVPSRDIHPFPSKPPISGSPQKSLGSVNSNAIGSLIETYDQSGSSLALSVAPLSAPAFQNPHERAFEGRERTESGSDRRVFFENERLRDSETERLRDSETERHRALLESEPRGSDGERHKGHENDKAESPETSLDTLSKPGPPEIQPAHTRHDSQSSNLSQVSNASTLTNNNQQRFVKYVMSTQSNAQSSSTRWSMLNVVAWLKHHGFNTTWQDTFKRNEISGNRFLELANYDLHSSVWRQLSMRLDESDDASTIERFIALLRGSEPDSKTPTSSEPYSATSATFSPGVHADDDVAEHRKSAASLWSNSNLQLPAKQRPYSYIDPGSSKSSTKEHSHKFFNRMHARTSSFESPKDGPPPPQVSKSAGEPFTSSRSRKSGIFSTLRKYGGEKAAEIKKQVQSPSITKSNSQRRRRDESRKLELHADRSSKSISQLYLPSEISPKSAQSFTALRLDEYPESTASSRRSSKNKDETKPDKYDIKRDDKYDIKRDDRYERERTDHKATRESEPKAKELGSKPITLADLVPPEQLPTAVARPHKQVLVSRDNTAFSSLMILPEQLSTAQTIKAAISDGLQLLDIGSVTFHLTDFHCKPGAPLSDEMLLSLASHDLLLKLYVHQSVDLTHETGTFSSTSSDSKSFDTSGDNGKMYPATPQYLLQDPRDKTIDYLNFKDKIAKNHQRDAARKMPKAEDADTPGEKAYPIKLTMPQSRRAQSQTTVPSAAGKRAPLVHGNSDFAPGHQISAAPGHQISAPGHHISAAEKAKALETFDYSNPSTFTVLRRAGREIDFDKRRQTPNESKAPRLIPNIFSSSVTNSSVSPISASTIHSFKEEIGASPSTSRSGSAFRTASNGSENSFVAKRKPPPPPTASNSLSKKKSMSALSFSSSRSESLTKSSKKFDFSNAPGIDLKDEDDEFFAKPIKKDDSDDEFFMKPIKKDDSDDEFFMKPIKKAVKLMAVRPPLEEVYDNLEKYFPNTILDKPIIDTAPEMPAKATAVNPSPAARKVSISRTFSNANMSPVIQSKDSEDEILYGEGPKLRKKMKTIRIVANEAKIKRLASMRAVSEARKDKSHKRHVYNAINPSLNRANTKLWGQKVVEVTSDDIEKGYVSRIRNVSSNSYEEFAWIKGELIGRGSFGSVFLALNVSTGEMLAVKQVELSDSSSNMEGIDALHKEVETMKDLDHLNIVQYLGFEQSKQTYSLFLEYVAGGSVASCLKSYGKFDEPLVKFITRQVLEGLKYIHENGILHRDLKADNLLLEIDGTCKISDFGISKKSQDIYSNNAEMSMQGTVFWMAPEVIHSMVEDKKQGYSAKVDIWSLGCVMVEMFAGKRPWSNEAVISAIYKLGKTKLAPPIPDEVSAEAKDFLNQCFTIDSSKRPTAQQLLGHEFMRNDGFVFGNTKLSEIIKYNSRKSIK